jgi:hypothetical protein
VLQECHKNVTRMSQECCNTRLEPSNPNIATAGRGVAVLEGVTMVLQARYKSVTRVLRECYKIDTRMLQEFYKRRLWCVFNVVRESESEKVREETTHTYAKGECW